MKRTITLAGVCLALALIPMTTFAGGGHDRINQDNEAVTMATTSVFITGKLKNVDAVTDSNWFTCSGSTYTDLPGMEVTFNSKKGGPVLIMFEGEFWGTDCILVRALHNGTEVVGPGDSSAPLHLDGTFATTDVYSTHGFNFVTMAVPGSNTVKIQCATHGTSYYRDVFNKSLVILHK